MGDQLITTNIPDLLKIGLDEIFFNEYNSFTDELEKFFEIVRGAQAYWDHEELVGFTTVPKLPESTPYTKYKPEFWAKKRHTPSRIGMAMQISYEMKRTEQYKKAAQFVKMMADIMRYQKAFNCADVFNYAHTTTLYVTNQGKAIFASDHPYKGGTFSNKDAANSQLTMTSFKAACVALWRSRSVEGLRIKMPNNLELVIPPDLYHVAKQLFQSPGVYNEANLSINPVGGEGHKSTMSNLLTSTTQWQVMADKKFRKWFKFIIDDVKTEKVPVADTDDEEYRISCWEGYGVDNGQGCWGSTGG